MIRRPLGALVGKLVYRTALVLLCVALLAPVVMVIVTSFSNSPFISFPPEEWGLRQYRELSRSPVWKEATLRSILIALPAAGIAIVLASALVLGLQRTRLKFEGAIVAICTLPLLVPGVALAIAIYSLYIEFSLLDSYTGMILAHVVHVLPLAVLIVVPSIRTLTQDLELAAMTLGATRGRAWIDITLRLLAPSLAAAGIIAFLNSFDEATLASFISGPRTGTLPKAILESVTTGLDPVITAISTLLIGATAALMTIAESLRSRRLPT